MKQQKRKGFTLVELLVVIAILAVLATVSIVGYTQFINKARISNDTALVKQINDLLIADEAINGKPGTMGGALEVVNENGFDVTKLTPTAQGYDFVYDVENNRFALVEGERVVFEASDRKLSANLADRWVIRANKDQTRLEGSSLYLTESVDALELTDLVGVEIANGCEIGTLSIDTDAEGSIVIAGKIGEVTIDAPNAEVDHSGVVGKVNIIAIKDKSWHEHGEITGNVTITSGHFVAESGSAVGAVIVKAEGVKVTVQNGSAVGGVVPVEGIDASKITIEGTKLSTPISEETLSLFDGGLGTQESPYLIANADQLFNIHTLREQMVSTPFYFALTNDIDLNDKDASIDRKFITDIFRGCLDGRNHTITCMPKQNYLFVYLFGQAEFRDVQIQWADTVTRMNMKYGFGFADYTMKDGKKVTTDKELAIKYDNVDFYGVNGVNYYAGIDQSAIYINGTTMYVYVSETTTNHPVTEEDKTNDFLFNIYCEVDGNLIEVENTNTIINCDVYADFNSRGNASDAAVFIGGQTGTGYYTIENCSYNGNFIGPSPALLISNSNDCVESTISVKNVVLKGTITCTSPINGGSLYYSNKAETALSGIEVASGGRNVLAPDATLDIINNNGALEITAATGDTDYYIISVKFGKLNWYKDNSYSEIVTETSTFDFKFKVETSNITNTGVYLAAPLTLKQAIEKGIVSDDFKCTKENDSGYSYEFVEKDGNMYLVIDFEKAGMYRAFENTDAIPTKYSVTAYKNGVPVATSSK